MNSIISVMQGPKNYLITQVKISIRGEGAGLLGYDQKSLAPRPMAAPKRTATFPKPGTRPAGTSPPSPATRGPRVRRVPTPPKT